jgi:hypothetical protein
MVFRKLKPRFGLRTLLVMVTALAILLGWCAHVVRKVRRTEEIAQRLEATGATVGFEGCSVLGIQVEKKTVPDWAWRFFGEAAFADVTYVWLDGGFGESPPSEKEIALLAELPQLNSIVCEQMDLPSNSIDVFSHLPNLKDVEFSSVDLVDSHLEMLAAAPKLRQLGLNSWGTDEITDETLARVSELQQLRSLELVWCGGVSSEGIRQLRKLSGLRELTFQEFDAANDESVVILAELPNLEVLELEGLSLSSNGCRPLSKLTKLRELSLSNCDVDDAMFVHLTSLPSLKVLTLHGTNMTDACVDDLLRFQQLEILTLSQTNLTNDGIRRLVALRGLKRLSLPCEGDLSACEEVKRSLPSCIVYACNSRGHGTEVTTAQ